MGCVRNVKSNARVSVATRNVQLALRGIHAIISENINYLYHTLTENPWCWRVLRCSKE